MIHPENKYYIAWTCLYICIITYALFATCFRLSFNSEISFCSDEVLIDLCLWFDIGLNFYVAFEQEGNFIFSREKIKKNYLENGFFYRDIIAVFPLDWILLVATAYQNAYIIRCFRIFRLINLFKFPMYSSKFLRDVSSNTILYLFRFMKLLIYTFFMVHMLTCIYWTFTFFREFGQDDWMPGTEYLDRDMWSQYLHLLTFMISLLTGQADIASPVTHSQAIFALFVNFVSICLLAYIIGSIIHIVDDATSDIQEFKNGVSELSRFLNIHNLPYDIRKRCIMFNSYSWTRTKGFDNNKFIQTLPGVLRGDVCLHLAGPILQRSSLFSGLEHLNINFCRELVQVMRMHSVTINEYLYRRGDADEMIYFLESGEVLIEKPVPDAFSPSKQKLIKANECFGFETMFDDDCFRETTAFTARFCDLWLLKKADMREILTYYPEMKSILFKRLRYEPSMFSPKDPKTSRLLGLEQSSNTIDTLRDMSKQKNSFRGRLERWRNGGNLFNVAIKKLASY